MHGHWINRGFEAMTWVRMLSLEPPTPLFPYTTITPVVFSPPPSAMHILQDLQPMTKARMAELSLPDIRAYARVMFMCCN